MSFSDGSEVKLLPQSYYTLPSDKRVTIKKGKVLGYLDVKLEDAFLPIPRLSIRAMCYLSVSPRLPILFSKELRK